MAKHLSLEDRNLIAQHLNERCSFKAIANELGKTVPVFQGKSVIILFLRKQEPPENVLMHVNTGLAAKNSASVRNVPIKGIAPYVRTASSVTIFARTLKRKYVRNFCLLHMSATAVRNVIPSALWKNDIINL